MNVPLARAAHDESCHGLRLPGQRYTTTGRSGRTLGRRSPGLSRPEDACDAREPSVGFVGRSTCRYAREPGSPPHSSTPTTATALLLFPFTRARTRTSDSRRPSPMSVSARRAGRPQRAASPECQQGSHVTNSASPQVNARASRSRPSGTARVGYPFFAASAVLPPRRARLCAERMPAAKPRGRSAHGRVVGVPILARFVLDECLRGCRPSEPKSLRQPTRIANHRVDG